MRVAPRGDPVAVGGVGTTGVPRPESRAWAWPDTLPGSRRRTSGRSRPNSTGEPWTFLRDPDSRGQPTAFPPALPRPVRPGGSSAFAAQWRRRRRRRRPSDLRRPGRPIPSPGPGRLRCLRLPHTRHPRVPLGDASSRTTSPEAMSTSYRVISESGIQPQPHHTREDRAERPERIQERSRHIRYVGARRLEDGEAEQHPVIHANRALLAAHEVEQPKVVESCQCRTRRDPPPLGRRVPQPRLRRPRSGPWSRRNRLRTRRARSASSATWSLSLSGTPTVPTTSGVNTASVHRGFIPTAGAGEGQECRQGGDPGQPDGTETTPKGRD